MPAVENYNMDFYFPKADAVATSMIHRFTFYMEGESDAHFYERFFDRNKLRFRACGGKSEVLGRRDEYLSRGQLDDSDDTECLFCVDRDFDEKLDLPQIEDEEKVLFYQLSKRARIGGFNDLECMQFRASLAENVLMLYYNIEPEKAKQMVNSAISVAAILGCYRIANRHFKGNSKRNILWQYRDREDSIEPNASQGCCEIGPYFLFKYGVAVVRDGLVSVDENKLQQELKRICGRDNDSDVNSTLEIAKQYREEIKDGNDLDFCRGHDITYFLCAQLQRRLGQKKPNNRGDLEGKFILVLSNPKIFCECRKFISQYEFVKKLEQVSSSV